MMKKIRVSEVYLPTYIPNSEVYVLEFNRFNIESYCWYGGDYLTNLKLIQYGGLSSCIKSELKRNTE